MWTEGANPVRTVGRIAAGLENGGFLLYPTLSAHKLKIPDLPAHADIGA